MITSSRELFKILNIQEHIQRKINMFKHSRKCLSRYFIGVLFLYILFIRSRKTNKPMSKLGPQHKFRSLRVSCISFVFGNSKIFCFLIHNTNPVILKIQLCQTIQKILRNYFS